MDFPLYALHNVYIYLNLIYNIPTHKNQYTKFQGINVVHLCVYGRAHLTLSCLLLPVAFPFPELSSADLQPRRTFPGLLRVV